MTDNSELYANVERKRELVQLVHECLVEQLDASDVLDVKAWELLKFSGLIFGVIASIEIALVSGDVLLLFWQALVVVSLCYIVQTVLILQVIRPREWATVPGVPDGKILNYENFVPNYMAQYNSQTDDYEPLPESRYLDQLLTDHLGTEAKKGAIAKAQVNNDEKARLLWWASGLQGVIIVGLVLMAVASMV